MGYHQDAYVAVADGTQWTQAKHEYWNIYEKYHQTNWGISVTEQRLIRIERKMSNYNRLHFSLQCDFTSFYNVRYNTR
jgi:hypothetical protein